MKYVLRICSLFNNTDKVRIQLESVADGIRVSFVSFGNRYSVRLPSLTGWHGHKNPSCP